MKVQDLINANNEAHTTALFQSAYRVPEDKIEWKPDGEGRSVLDLCQECALSTRWPLTFLDPEKPFKFTPEMVEEHERERAKLTTIAECEAKAKAGLEHLGPTISALPDARMEEMVEVPFGETHLWPMHQVLQMHMWNCIYHTGQVNYIQTLYGDRSM